MFERFTDRARKVRALANQEAQRLSHDYVGTEHVLLGLVKEGAGVGAIVLKNLGVDLHKVRSEVEKLCPPGPDKVTMAKLPMSPTSKKAFERAIEEARLLNHNYVGTEHLLLGLTALPECTAGKVLGGIGLKLEEVRDEVLNIVQAGTKSSETPAGKRTRRRSAASQKLVFPKALAEVVEAWPTLADPLQAAILAIVRTMK